MSHSKSIDLRNQGLALIAEAQALDGLQPFVITHHTEYGSSAYIGWFPGEPDEEKAAAVLDSEFEPDKDETLYIHSSITLEELTGASSGSRFPV